MSAKRRKFKTEVQQLLDLVVHSLYSNKDIFLRELISNSSDAIDRARFEALADEGVLEDDPDWKIKIHVDKDAKTITVSDNGFGMTPDEVEKNIGTIANSGTRRFLEQLRENKDALPPEFIGQFGVGFYSAFMVADSVTLVTRPPGDRDAGSRWKSSGTGSYTIEPAQRDRRGTEVILSVKEGMEEYLEEWKLRKIVKQFSDFVEHPIVMDVQRDETPRDADGNPVAGAEPTSTTAEEQLNSGKAIWQRRREEIAAPEYAEFYRHISHDFQEPLETVHWNVEGATEFCALLYVPKKTPFELFTPETRRHGIQLYVKRVFITDHCEELTPPYLRFLRGVVDSSDLPLNVSREILQENRLLRLIRNNLVRKVLDTLAGMKDKNRERYVEFWTEFGAMLKEGVHTDIENREKIQELLLFESTKTEPGALVSLHEYAARMPAAQPAIYCIPGESRDAVARSPHLEAFRERDYEVLFLTDPIDEWLLESLRTYGDKPLQSVAKGDVDLPPVEGQPEPAPAEDEEAYKALLDTIRKALGDRVKDVRLSRRLTESACCLVADEQTLGLHMEKILKAMKQDVPPAARILELNPQHALMQTLRTCIDRDPANPRIAEYAELLHDQALLTAGLVLNDPLQLAQRLTRLMTLEAESLAQAGENAAAAEDPDPGNDTEAEAAEAPA